MKFHQEREREGVREIRYILGSGDIDRHRIEYISIRYIDIDIESSHYGSEISNRYQIDIISISKYRIDIESKIFDG